MIVRDVRYTDLPAIDEVYKQQNFDYEMPDISKPLFITKKVVVDEAGRILGCVVVKLQGECFLFLPPDTSLREKAEAIKKLDEAATQDCWEKGLDQVTSWIPTEIEEGFSKRLTKLGFIKSKWNSWTKNLI